MSERTGAVISLLLSCFWRFCYFGADQDRIATFVAINLCGPEIHSIYRWRNQHLVHLDGGFEENNFKVLGKLYKEAMSNLGVKHVPVLAAEDETAILGQISYSERTD